MRQLLQRYVLTAILLTMLAFLVSPISEVKAEGTAVQQNITTDTVWTKAGSPYTFSAPISIESNATLTIEPGVKVTGSPFGGTWLDIKGKLKAIGTEQEPINITDVYLNAWDFSNTTLHLEYAKVNKTNKGGFLITSSGQEVILKNNEFANALIDISAPKALHLIENNLFQATAPVSIDGGAVPAAFNRNTFFNTEDDIPAIEVDCSEGYACESGNIRINENNFFGQVSRPHVYVKGSKTFTFDGKKNYWGTTDENRINSRIKDATDGGYERNTLEYKPYAAMPFVNGHPYGELEPPTVKTISDADSFVSGKTDANTTVKITWNGSLIGTGISDETGNYQVAIAKQKAGTLLTISATDSLKRISNNAVTNVTDGTAPASPTVKPVYTKATSITGMAEPLSTIIVKIDGSPLPRVTADDKGNFSVPMDLPKAGTIIEVQAMDASANRSPWTTLVVTEPPVDTVAPDVWVELVYDYSTEIKGLSEPEAQITIFNGEQWLGTTTANSDGIYTLSIPPQTGGSILTITAKDASQNEKTITSKVFTTKQRWVTVNEVTTNSKAVTGKVQYPNAYITITANGQTIAEGRAEADGTFSIIIPAQPEGTHIWVHTLNTAGDSSDSVLLQVKWAPPHGWYTKDGYKYYYDSVTGKHKTGWFYFNSKWYFFEADGKMKTGWKLLGGKWYYLQPDGIMKTGWLLYGGSWYYFPASGEMKIGWLQEGKTMYYFTKDGAMKTGWLLEGKSWYYFTSSGAMKTGWLQLGKSWFYFNANGIMQTGTIIISGKKYTFNASGVWIK